MKKFFITLMCIVMVVCFMPTVALAEGETPASTLPEAVDGTINLTRDVVLAETAVLSGTVVINLNNHKISTVDKNGNEGTVVSALKISAGANVTIKGEDRSKSIVCAGSATNLTGYNTQVSTIILGGGATLTIENATVEGSKGINTKYGGHAIKASSRSDDTSSININNSVVKGGDCEKKGVTTDNVDTFSYKYDGEAGEALYSVRGNVVITNSEISGGNGLSTNCTEAYISGGINFAEGAYAMSLYGGTVGISNSSVTGGGSTFFNAGNAINIANGKETTLTISENSVVTGGTADGVIPSYGIGGAAIEVTLPAPEANIMITDSQLIGGNAGQSYIGCGVEINNDGTSFTADNSVIAGGNSNNGGAGYGNAVYINGWTSSANIELNNTELKADEKAYGYNETGAAAVYKQSSSTPDNLVPIQASGDITISGGTLSNVAFSVPEGKDLYLKKTEGTIDTTGSVTITKTKGESTIVESYDGSVAEVGGERYLTLQAAINAAAAGQTVVLREDTTGHITIPVGAEVTIEGNGKTLKGSIYFTQTKEGGTTKATINNLTLDGQSSSGYGIFGQNTKGNGLVVNELTLNNCTIKNFEKKGIYLTNAKKLDINRCTFEDNATGGTGSEPYGDYAVDLNLYDVQDADISITDCNFEDFSGSKAAIKVTQRGGNDDEGATDGITKEPAKIKQLTIKNCVFNNGKPSNTYLGDIVLGSGPNKDGTPKASCGAFPVTITAEDDTTVCQRYISDGSKVTIPDGQTFTKGANTAPITRVYPTYYPTIPTDSLKTVRTEAIKAVTDYVNPADYEEAQQAEIKTIVDNAKKDIEAAKTADEIKAIEAAAKAELDKLETAEEMSLIRAIGETKFVARSKAVTLKNGKKAIKITWYDKNGKEVKFDGVEIFRSTKRYSGYGKEPIYVSKSGVYYNTAIEAGTKYYYKVRGYVLVNGEKVYTDYSTKAWRTA